MSLFEQASELFGLPAGLLVSLCTVESNQRNVINFHDSGSPSFGVCQLKYKTAKYVVPTMGASELMIPERNIFIAAEYLASQKKRYNSWTKAIAAYNAGRAARLSDGRFINQTYVNKVTKLWKRNARFSPCARSLMSNY